LKKGNDVADRHSSLYVGFIDLPAEMVLERKPNLHQLQAVSTEILDQMGFVDDAPASG
jgi:hypothetical protein